MQFDECSSCLNTADGQVYMLPDDAMRAAEDDNPDAPRITEWVEEDFELAKQILADDTYVRLPSKYDIHEYRIMEAFCDALEDSEISAELAEALRGRGAFRRFKDTCHRLDVIDQWYAFKTNALKEITIEWCQANKIECEE